MIQANELRIGNILNYQTAEGDTLPTILNWQGLQWISQDQQGFNLIHNSIPLTPEMLLKCGFKWVKPLKAYTHDDMDCEVSLNSKETENYALHELNTKGFGGTIPATYYDRKFYLTSNGEYLVSTKPIQFIHQFQNLFYALTGEELEVKL